MEKFALVAPHTIIKLKMPMFTIVKTLFIRADSLTPMIMRQVTAQAKPNARKSGYGPRPVKFMARFFSKKLLIFLLHK